ncbi:glycosyltransferase [bacterium]|nr:glycosyltransferase [bacterium]
MEGVVAAYFLTLVGLAVFGAHRYVVLYLFHRHKNHRDDPPPGRFDDLPPVTVQLPLYNEMYVARRLVDAVARLDYPRNRLQIQVLDDSTDETRGVVDEAVAFWRGQGVNVEAVRRPTREGFKAGALEFGLASATGEFIAVFDADFVPRADFLNRTVHEFTDPSIGMVQARWEHLNEGYSIATRLQALYLDGHFVMEHAARNWSGRYFNFNGTAGIWRKQAILDAGGWQHDTITEDLDLSYRAQMAGWKFKYLLDYAVPGELPALLSAFRSQQYRWAKGAIETARKILPPLWRGPYPLKVKIEATVHLLSNCAYLLVALLCLLSGPSMMIRVHMGWRATAWLDLLLFMIVSFSIGVYYLECQRVIGKSVRKAALYLPLLMGLGIGMVVNNARAVVSGMRGRKSAFIRTPKHKIETSKDSIVGKKYRSAFNSTILVEALGAMIFVPPLMYAVRYDVWVSVPFQLLFFTGFSYLVLATLMQTAKAAWGLRGQDIGEDTV